MARGVAGTAVILLGTLLPRGVHVSGRGQVQRPCLASATPTVKSSWQAVPSWPHKRQLTANSSLHGLPAVSSLAADAAPALNCLQAQLRQNFLEQHDRSLDNLGPFWQGYLNSGDRLDRSGRLLMQRLKPVS